MADAQAILQYLTFSENETEQTGEWEFRTINNDKEYKINVTADATGLDFTAYVLGDANGNWGLPNSESENTPTHFLTIPSVEYLSETQVAVPIYLEDNQTSVNSIVLTLEFDSSILTVNKAKLAGLSNQFLLASNSEEEGKLHLAMASAGGFAGDGDVLRISFNVNSAEDFESVNLEFARVVINDKEITNNVDRIVTSVGAETTSQIPDRFALLQNYPNPFNPTTTINYAIPQSHANKNVRLEVYNLLGQRIRTLVNEKRTAGYHSIQWDGKNDFGVQVSSGLFLYQLAAGSFVEAKKMLLLR